ncbi:uncharacterized protein LOC121911233 [Thunnus maccoyii]|uniref:uncharacterized protein LOC121911233 n=1 Tax=Thunnus maccoyii TaxID=8240 RepID=UPI001C4C04A4|nr:uncharacterized protein LOC121911233 [Thunnus maccoyii]
MEKLTGCFLSAVLLLVVLNSVLAENTFFEEGGSVTLLLRPPFSGEITIIVWMHNDFNQVAKWMKDVPSENHGTFKGRTTLNTTTGSLKIINMSRADSGEYSVMINNDFQDERYNATLIKAVPQPVALVKPPACAAASKQCTLTCYGNTGEAEPVTYSWKMGGEWMVGEKDRNITNDETIQRVKMFSCRMKNPISEKESDPKPNPFFKEKVSASSGVELPVDLFLLVVGILATVVGAGF